MVAEVALLAAEETQIAASDSVSFSSTIYALQVDLFDNKVSRRARFWLFEAPYPALFWVSGRSLIEGDPDLPQITL